MKRLLITGADGFTGQHLRIAAEQVGYEVFSLHSDLTDSSALLSEVVSVCPSHIIHLAAISAVTHADQEAFYRINLFGTLNLLDALKGLPICPENVLLASSANVYGNADIELITEAVCPKPVNHYAMSKLAMEHMALTNASDLPIVITRPFNYTGIGHDNRFVIPKIVEHFKRGAAEIELGNLDVYREYNDVRMVCDAYLKLLEYGVRHEIYNICTGRAYSLREIISTVEEVSRRNIDIKVNPAFFRANEVYKLAGNPEKLKATVGELRVYSLQETLSWMLLNNK